MKKSKVVKKAVSTIFAAMILGGPTVGWSQTTATSVPSQPQGSSSVKAKPSPKVESTTGAKILLDLSTSSNLAAEGTAEREASVDLDIRPSYQINKNISVGARSILTQDQTGPKDTTISDTSLSLSIAGPTFGESVATSGTLSGILPTSENSSKRDRLRAGAAVTGGLVWQASKFTTKYSLAARQNFHEFNLNAEGDPNIRNTITQVLSTEYAFNDTWSVSAEGLYRMGYTYANSPRQSYEFTTSLAANVTNSLSVNVGFGNQGAVFRPNGVDSNVRAWDDRSSVIFAGLTFVR